jgi:preprotein translocase subunit SecD
MRLRLASLLALIATGALAGEVLKLTVDNATMTTVQGTGPAMSISLSPESTDAFAAFTAANIGKTMVLRMDGKTLISGVIREAITNGRFRVGGEDFTAAELRALATSVPYGKVAMEAEIADPPQGR